MTVAELIEQLSKMPQDLPVYVPDRGCGCCSDGEGYDADNVIVQGKTVYIG